MIPSNTKSIVDTLLYILPFLFSSEVNTNTPLLPGFPCKYLVASSISRLTVETYGMCADQAPKILPEQSVMDYNLMFIFRIK